MRIEGLSDLTPGGSGGFSQVFRAIQTRYERVVAAKVLNFRLEAEGDRERFESECRAMGQLSDHPHIVPLYSTTYTDEGYPVIIMEYFAGGTLADRSRRGISEVEVISSGVKIASALHCAHDRGVIHRDVKPQNVLMSRFSEPALTDFGISAIVQQKVGVGKSTGLTLAYAAPEALDGETSTLTDVYSLAATLYTALAKQRPFDTPGIKQPTNELVRRILHEEPPSLQTFGYSAAVDSTVRRAGMAKEAGRRPQSAREFGEMLRELERREGYAPTAWTEARDMTDMSLPTTDGGDESITLVRRHDVGADEVVTPAPDGERPTGWTLRRSLALLGAAVALAALTFVLLTARNAEDVLIEPEVTTTEPTLDPLFQRAIFAPTDVTIERTGQGTAMVRWVDPNEGSVTFEVQRADFVGLDDLPVVSETNSAEISNVGDNDAPCVVVRALGDLGQISPDTPAVCLSAKIGEDPVVAVVPPSCDPGACDFRLDGKGFFPGGSVAIVVLNPDGVDLNSLFGTAYESRADVLTNGTINWLFDPGNSAPAGTYEVRVIDEQSGLSTIAFLELTAPE